MIKLTKRQSDVLETIRQHISETGFPPTRAEIAARLGFRSPNAAEEHLKALSKKGAIEMLSGASRGIRLINETPAGANDSDLGLPVVGKVAAGAPILAQENVATHISVPPSMFSPKADYLLSVSGMSMKDVGIMDGDLLAVHKTHAVRNGQIVVARIGEEVTVKRFEKKGSKVRLIAENTEFDDILVDLESEEFAIEGLSVGVIRQGI
ncbi:transcriptional repressor LexA [Marinomonas mediterranea]|jgi:SOS-response transcriptional repressor, LexA|uniref:LexA repressor n=1 Tax=Marinomonas mediterranea (strain ATCC 700492 / JCM 21426 / NBRC 103028 / MMB-1) TaxID=717774 RepID=F2JTH7_MARM1|nr:transcriptional repressor LexA [Marinomonas mediterranea]ADZ91491.1 SOS-response transcriptional repressor, LexA [Marinomonas mediterranea MMB-1]WCN09458.1 transcriptional repressor LexA [Marinomonas mediterranea]WCN13534.1 transcriptional repressor LexA [Marinomonas mediterranea]WCN17600.1 transcriptional repressor LexA [Marinomonas mediterranea MMB-1]